MSNTGAEAILLAELKRKLTVAVDAGQIEKGYEYLHQIQELVNKQEKQNEIAEALGVLDKHGVTYRVWDYWTVRQLVEKLPGENLIDVIVGHVTEGDDWASVGVAVDEVVEQKVWEIISGTASDHMEWFSRDALRQL